MSSITSDMRSKRVELLKEIVPDANSVAVLWNPANVSKVAEWKESQAAADISGLSLHSAEAKTPSEIEHALTMIARQRPDAMIVLADGLTIAFRQRLGAFALHKRLELLHELLSDALTVGILTNPQEPSSLDMSAMIPAARALGIRLSLLTGTTDAGIEERLPRRPSAGLRHCSSVTDRSSPSGPSKSPH
jgi:ABC-type uncharacterized transport system substrate-binding protein